MLDAIFYLLRTSSRGGLLPKCFPPRTQSSVTSAAGRQDGACSACTTRCWSWHARPRAVRARPTAGIVDSRSVRTSESGGPRGYDAGKKIDGRKRHILVDTLGLLLRGIVHCRQRPGRDGLAALLTRIRRRFPFSP